MCLCYNQALSGSRTDAMTREWLLLLFWLVWIFTLPQKLLANETDSLLAALQQAKTDSIKGRIYLQLAKSKALSDPLKRFEYINKGLGLGLALDVITRAELQLELGKYNRLAGDYTNAVKNMLTALAVFEQHQENMLMADCYNSLAIAYFDAGRLEEAETSFKKSLQLYKELKDNARVAVALNNIGEIYQRRSDPIAAQTYYQKAYELALEQGDLQLQSVLMNNFGDTNYNLGKYSRAIYFQNRALKMAEALADVEGLSYSFLALAKAYHKLANYDSALYFGQRGLATAKANGINYLIKEGLFILKDIYFANNNFEKALRYADSVIFLIDTVYNQDKNKLITQSFFQYELGRQQSQIELLEKEKIINSQKLLNATLNRKIIYTILASFVAILVILLYFLRQRQIQSDQLAQKNAMLDAKNQELKILNQTKDKLFSIIAHDLRSPLSALKNVLDLVDFNLLSPTDFAVLAVDVRKNLTSILYTLNNLLEWSYLQIKVGDSVSPVANNVKELITETVSFYEEVARQKNIDIIVEVDDNDCVTADKNHLRFVLRNLLNNAIKFSYPQSQILIRTTKLPDRQIEIAVRDNGAGMEEEVKAQLFSPGMRSAKGTAGEQGTGLGLMLCKDFIEKNGGEIFVESQVDRGSTFKIVLPQ